jgi:hypothetical protein
LGHGVSNLLDPKKQDFCKNQLQSNEIAVFCELGGERQGLKKCQNCTLNVKK